MEADSLTCPRKSESEKLHLCEDKEPAITEDDMEEKKNTPTDPQDINKGTEAISRLEKTETPDSNVLPELHDHPTSPPEDGGTEPTVEDSTDENDSNGNQGQEWPPVPGLEDIQPDGNESHAIQSQGEAKDNTETTVQTSMKDTEGGESVSMTQVDKGTDSPQKQKVTNEEEGHELESHGDSDSIVFLSENSEELNIDYKPVDFATTREQWVRRDSRCDEPESVVCSKSSLKSIEAEPSSRTQSESELNTKNVQQRESEVNKTNDLNENKVVQQVCGAAPPLETVAANPEQGNSAVLSMEVKEPLIMPQGRRDSEREEREGSETGEERKQTVYFTETGGTEEEEVKVQIEEQENTGQREESRSNTKPHLEEGTVNRMQVDHFDDSQSDSGVSTDFSPNSTTDVSEGHVKTDAPQPSESPPNETPIEREIRLAIKREQSLRRSRGLCDTTDKTNEYVEIPLRKSILSQDLQIRANPRLGKDSQFAGKKMQKEISAETEREKVLVELGRLPGFYDKGTEVQLQEKKLLFESFQEPQESAATFPRRSASNSTYMEPAAEIQEVDSAGNVRQRHVYFSENSPNPTTMAQYRGTNGSPPAARGPGLTEGTKGQIIIIEANSFPTTVGGPNRGYTSTTWTDEGSVKMKNSAGVRASSAEPVSARQSRNADVIEDEDTSAVNENPFFKLRSSMTLHSQVELDIKEARKREKELQRLRNSLYGGATMDPEEARRAEMHFRTESRVREGIESPGKEIHSRPPPQTPTGRQSEISNTTMSARQSTGKLDLTWPPSQADEVRQSTGKLDLTWPPSHSDEQQRPTSKKTQKIPRQRNPLLDRWESGMVNGYADDSD